MDAHPDAPQLGDIARIICGPFGSAVTESDYSETGIPFLRISDLTAEGGVDESEMRLIPETLADVLAATQMMPGDLVISQRGTLGVPAVIPATRRKWNISANLIGIRKLERLPAEFVQFFLASRPGADQLERRQSGQVNAKITTADVASVYVPVPHDAAEMVADLDAARVSRQAKLDEADSLLAGLGGYLMDALGLTLPAREHQLTFAVRTADLIGDRIDPPAHQPFTLDSVPADVSLLPLREVAVVNGNPSLPAADDNKLVPYIGLPECSQTAVSVVSKREYAEVKNRNVVVEGDILFARIEPSVFNQKYVLADDLKGYPAAATSTEFYTVRAKPDRADQQFLYAMFFCPFVFEQIKGKTTGSSGRRRIDRDLFERLLIPVPSLSRQESIAGEVRRRRADARRIRAEATREWAEARAAFEARLIGDPS